MPVSAAGFINLFGVTVLKGIVLVSYLNTRREDGLQGEEPIVNGCLLRRRPVLMTALVVVLGLLHLTFGHGIGSEVQCPLAVVVIGELISSALLTLIVFPELYGWMESRSPPK